MTTLAHAPTDRAEAPLVAKAGVLLALVVLWAPSVLGCESLLALPGTLGLNLAKGMEAISLALLAIWLLHERWWPRLEVAVVLALLFIGHAVISGLWATDLASYKEQLKRLVHGSATGVAIYLVIRDRIDLEKILLGWKLLSFAIAVLVMVEIYVPGFRLDRILPGKAHQFVFLSFEADLGSFHRAYTPLGHPNWAGFFFGSVILLNPYFWARYTSVRARVLLVLFVIIEIYALILCYVRLGMLGLFVGSAWLWVRGVVKHRTLAVMAAITGAALLWPLLPDTWKTRTFDPHHYEHSNSVAIRSSLQVEGLQLAMKYGSLGVGYGGYGNVFFHEARGAASQSFAEVFSWTRASLTMAQIGSHDAYLEILIEQGVIGLGLWLAAGLTLFLGVHRATRQAAVRRDHPGWILGLCLEAMMVSLAVMTLLLHIQARRVLWTYFAVAALYVRLTRQGDMDGPLPAPPCVPPAVTRILLSIAGAIACAIAIRYLLEALTI